MLSRSSSRHSSARISGTCRALIEPAWASAISSSMTRSLDFPGAGGTSLTVSGT